MTRMIKHASTLTAVIVGAGAIAALFLTRHAAAQEPYSTSNYEGARGDDDRNNRTRDATDDNARALVEQGRKIFRFDTFGDEEFWGDALKLHQAIAGSGGSGVGPGLSPKAALALGLKVDIDALPRALVNALKNGTVDLTSPATTTALLKLNAVVGITGFHGTDGKLRSVGIQCALCHSTVDDSFAPGIGRRRDGWANRDLNVGAIIALAPDLTVFTKLLGVDDPTVRAVLNSWGPGRFDAELALDGKAFRPDGKSGSVLIPPAFGLAGVNLGTWTGFGSTTYWNALVANLEMHGKGTFYDPRLNDVKQFPLAVKAGVANTRSDTDLITSKLAALHFYQLAIPIPRVAPADINVKYAAERGKSLFNGKAQCARCHVPPLFTEPGFNMHTPEEIGIDDFQANRSPTRMYRTAPLRGLVTHQKGGFYHDGRYPNLRSVIDHYDDVLRTFLSENQKADLLAYLGTL
jgi:mono/diheme cytochrome c family protein